MLWVPGGPGRATRCRHGHADRKARRGPGQPQGSLGGKPARTPPRPGLALCGLGSLPQVGVGVAGQPIVYCIAAGECRNVNLKPHRPGWPAACVLMGDHPTGPGPWLSPRDGLGAVDRCLPAHGSLPHRSAPEHQAHLAGQGREQSALTRGSRAPGLWECRCLPGILLFWLDFHAPLGQFRPLRVSITDWVCRVVLVPAWAFVFSVLGLELRQGRVKGAGRTGGRWPETAGSGNVVPWWPLGTGSGKATSLQPGLRLLSAGHLPAPPAQVVNLDFTGSVARVCSLGPLGGSAGGAPKSGF